ncbi:hypothetical protein BDQ17DRAFT_1355820 [Cyathus striatus]|nr:hypothetical protein BDQ17DRAFT_1355820 [Cyathus striatus]
MSNATLTDLPVELLQRIATFLLFERNLNALQSASLVCRYLAPAFQEGVFAQVILDIPIQRSGATTGIEQFSSITRTSPHLLSYIRTLGVLLTSQDLLCHVLRNAPNIRKLRLTGQLFTGEWSTLGEETRASIASALITLSVQQLHLDFVRRLPLSFLMPCRALRHLSLTSYEPDPQHLPLLSINEAPLQLETLQLALDSESLSVFAEWLLQPQCSFDISCLRRLYLNSDFGDDENLYFWRLMQKCSSSLENLMFDLIPNGISPPLYRDYLMLIGSSDKCHPGFDFAILSGLRSLRIRLIISGSEEEVWVWHAFRNIDITNNSLQSIHIDMLCDEVNHEVTWVYDVFLPKVFPKTSVYITVYGSNAYIEEQVSKEIMMRSTNPAGNAHSINFKFSPEDPYDDFLQFSSEILDDRAYMY